MLLAIWLLVMLWAWESTPAPSPHRPLRAHVWTLTKPGIHYLSLSLSLSLSDMRKYIWDLFTASKQCNYFPPGSFKFPFQGETSPSLGLTDGSNETIKRHSKLYNIKPFQFNTKSMMLSNVGRGLIQFSKKLHVLCLGFVTLKGIMSWIS